VSRILRSKIVDELRSAPGPVTVDALVRLVNEPRDDVFAELRSAARDGHVSLTFVDGALAGKVAA
jgi:hypothetical protein